MDQREGKVLPMIVRRRKVAQKIVKREVFRGTRREGVPRRIGRGEVSPRRRRRREVVPKIKRERYPLRRGDSLVVLLRIGNHMHSERNLRS